MFAKYYIECHTRLDMYKSNGVIPCQILIEWIPISTFSEAHNNRSPVIGLIRRENESTNQKGFYGDMDGLK